MKFKIYLTILICLLSVGVIKSPSLAQPESFPIIRIDWSDDGSKIAIVNRKRLTILASVRDIRPFTPVALRLFPSDPSDKFAQPYFPYFSPDGRRILINNEIWDSQTVETLLKIDTNGYMPQWSSDGTSIAFHRGDDQGISIYSAIDGSLLRTFSSPVIWRVGYDCKGEGWSPNNHYFSRAARDSIYILDALTGEEVNKYQLTGDNLGCPIWSPDSTHLVITSSVSVKLNSPDSHPDPGAPGKARRESVIVINAADGTKSTTITGLRDGVEVVWSPDGKQLAGRDNFRSLYIWNAGTGALIDSYLLPPYSVELMKYSPYGGRLMIGFNTARSLSIRPDSSFVPKSTFAQSFLDEAIQVVAPDASPDRLLKILSQCVSEQTTLIKAKEYIDAGQFRAFNSWASHVSINVVPEVCAADLQLMAQAIIGIEIRPSVAQAPTASIVN